jgi:alpha-beta hydrolase superfamily lysophospholipase
MTEHTFQTWDGAKLFYRAWLPETAAKHALLLFHRGHEHSGRWQETVDRLNLEDTAIFAWDQRGHGQSPGERGSAVNLAAVIKDADCFARHLEHEHGIQMERTAVLAHSVGAVIAAAWVHDYAPPICGLVLAAPAFRVKLYVPLAIPALRLRQKALGHGYVKSYVKSSMLTHDPAQAAAYNADPAIFRQIAVNILLDLHDTSTRLVRDAGAITTPTLMLSAGADWVVKLGPQRQFYERLSSATKQMELFPGMGHALFHESNRAEVVSRARDFLTTCFNNTTPRQPQVHADRGGYTRTEYDTLRLPSSAKWRFTKAALQTAGKLSDGIKLGCKDGFDSGVMLDYVYENKPRGSLGIGRLIDRNYLNSVGWAGIRARRANMEMVLSDLIHAAAAAGHPVRILDIASGPGRYVLHTLKSLNVPGATALLRDYKDVNIDAARRLAADLGLSGVEVAKGDAFDGRISRRDPSAPEHRHRVGSLRALPRQRAPASLSFRARATARAGKPPHLHLPALAPAGRVHRPHSHQP